MHAIKLGNNEFEGRNNAYLLDGDGTTALIDTGVSTPEIREQLTAGLAEHDRSFADVDVIVLTHWHPDHTGLAGTIQEAGGATVCVHEADAPLVRQDADAMDAMRQKQLARYDEWGMPDDKLEELLARLDAGVELAGHPAAVETFADGDRIDIGDLTLHAIHAPGHTDGLCCFAFDASDGREAFVGDAVLPVYTPNVGGADVRVDRPLAKYLETLRRIENAGFERIWPGHRDVIDDPAARARTIIDHHEERTRRVIDVLREHGPADAWTVSAHLFGELEGIHIMHGPGEAYAHLDHLEHNGVVESTADGYRLVQTTDIRISDLV